MLEDFVDHEKSLGRILYGYGRPLATTDERIAFTLDKAKEYGFSEGRYLKMAFSVYEHLNTTYGYSMNVAAVHAALAADMGFSCEEYQLILTPCFVAGMAPCFRDTKSRREGSFFPIRCESIVYHGREKRDWEG